MKWIPSNDNAAGSAVGIANKVKYDLGMMALFARMFGLSYVDWSIKGTTLFQSFSRTAITSPDDAKFFFYIYLLRS